MLAVQDAYFSLYLVKVIEYSYWIKLINLVGVWVGGQSDQQLLLAI